ncbi:myosin G, putative [Eimeria maxima]|uniref:Myosin G, putative n=1 Tax=Eimeria maxima TaxID=5804 RepID=U6MFQ5_EIMMA|nr:myosin G, putative [Eimeria maxima]CDJ60490.1 myosin G, putative [Eimeria maxima]
MAQQFWVPHPTEVWGVAVEVEGGESYRLLKAFDSATEEDDLTFSPNATERQLIKPILDLSGLQGVDNICGLSEVTEASVLQTVRQRYRDGLIYTNVGRILLSLNPFQFLPVYGEEIVAKYLLSDDPYSLQPHVYQIAADAFKSVSEEGTPQSALITGESGAGKTETTKLLLQFLAVAGGRKVRLGGRQDAVSGADGSDEDNSIERKLLEANPVLEAFANASTTRNPNSSRFGKWVEVIFSDKCVVMGARITSYLLEVPRVVGHATGERNFHVFYQLLEGLKDSLKGLQTDYQLSTEPASFSYLQPFDPRSRINDAEGLEELKHALLTLGFRAKQQNDLFSIVAALLHLGCICFVPDSGLLELFVTRPLKTGSEVIKAVLAPEKAAAARDGFAQLVYSCLFSWLIARVNESLQPPPQPCALETRMVGILDIAGFESFVRNGFEQLCINLSNEKLQNHFNQDIFLKELEDYEAEGLQGLNVSFQDNAQVLDAIEGKGGAPNAVVN